MDPGKEEGEECPRDLPPLPKEPEPRQTESIAQVRGKCPAVTGDLLIAGRLQHFLSNWKEIINDKVILDIVSGYNLEFTSGPSQNCVRNTFVKSTQAVYLDCEMQKLKDKGVIREVIPCDD